MTLTISTEENDSRELTVTVEVEEARVQKEMRKTARQLSKRFNIPGFRKGKAPFNVVASHLGGKQAIRAEAVESLVQPIFAETLEKIEFEPYAQASFNDMEIDPLVLKFTVPLEPVIELGPYRELRKEVDEVAVTDEALAEALERVQAQHAEIEEVDRAVEVTDLVTLSGLGELALDEEAEEKEAEAEEPEADEAAEESSESDPDEGDSDEGDSDEGNSDEEDSDEDSEVDLEDEASRILEEATSNVIFNEERLEVVIDAAKLFPSTSFVDHIVGLSAGEETSFSLSFPEAYEDEELAGKEAEFKITIIEVKKRELPELDDELAKLEGDFESLAELKENLQKTLLEQAESEAKNQLIEGLIDDVLEESTVTYPEAAVNQEIDGMMQNFKNQAERSGWDFNDFLTLQGGSEETMRDNFRESAAERLERQLILRQIVIDEMVTVEAEDIDAKVEKQVEAFKDDEELQDNMRNYYKSGYGFDMMSSEILMDKLHGRIKEIYLGNAPDLAELAAAKEAAEAAAKEADSAEEE